MADLDDPVRNAERAIIRVNTPLMAEALSSIERSVLSQGTLEKPNVASTNASKHWLQSVYVLDRSLTNLVKNDGKNY